MSEVPRLARRMVSVVAIGLGLGACGNKGSSQAAADGGSTPCEDYFDASFVGPCPTGPTLPPAELARERARFEQVCQYGLALPGSGLTDAQLEACATAIQSAGCVSSGTPAPAPCNFFGAQPNGFPCNEDFQCQSELCFQSAPVGEAGAPPSETTCGKCSSVGALGDPCSGSTCIPGAVCDTAATSPTCVTPTSGQQGAICDGVAKLCDAGLYCDTSVCTPALALGKPCSTSAQCAAPAICSAQACAAPGQAGDTCTIDADCAAGLGCSSQSSTCGSVTWASAGDACGDSVRCLVGPCPVLGVCPTVIADGQACTDPTSTCDDFSSCVDGTCVLEDSVACM